MKFNKAKPMKSRDAKALYNARTRANPGTLSPAMERELKRIQEQRDRERKQIQREERARRSRETRERNRAIAMRTGVRKEGQTSLDGYLLNDTLKPKQENSLSCEINKTSSDCHPGENGIFDANVSSGSITKSPNTQSESEGQKSIVDNEGIYDEGDRKGNQEEKEDIDYGWSIEDEDAMIAACRVSEELFGKIGE